MWILLLTLYVGTTSEYRSSVYQSSNVWHVTLSSEAACRRAAEDWLAANPRKPGVENTAICVPRGD